MKFKDAAVPWGQKHFVESSIELPSCDVVWNKNTVQHGHPGREQQPHLPVRPLPAVVRQPQVLSCNAFSKLAIGHEIYVACPAGLPITVTPQNANHTQTANPIP